MLLPAVFLYSGEFHSQLFRPVRVRSKALNRVQPSLKKNIFIFFNCVLFEKLEGDRLMT